MRRVPGSVVMLAQGWVHAPPPTSPGALVHALEREQSLEGWPGGRLLHGSLCDSAALLEDLVG